MLCMLTTQQQAIGHVRNHKTMKNWYGYAPTAKRLFEMAWMSTLRPTGSSSVQRPCTPMLLLFLQLLQTLQLLVLEIENVAINRVTVHVCIMQLLLTVCLGPWTH